MNDHNAHALFELAQRADGVTVDELVAVAGPTLAAKLLARTHNGIQPYGRQTFVNGQGAAMNITAEAKPTSDRKLDRDGYVLIRRPDHPFAASGGWVAEHRVILLDLIGPGDHQCVYCTRILGWMRQGQDMLCVDHVNEVKTDNAPENLVPCCRSCNSRKSAFATSKRRDDEAVLFISQSNIRSDFMMQPGDVLHARDDAPTGTHRHEADPAPRSQEKTPTT